MLKWIRTWFSDTARSAYDVKFFADRAKKHSPKSIRHLYGTLWILCFLSSIALSFAILIALPHVRAAVASLKEVAPTLYPAELVVTIKDGNVSTNVREPYAIELPPKWRELASKEETGAAPHLLVIDTRARAEDFPKKNTFILLTKQSIVIPDENDTVKFYSLKDVGNITITKQLYTKVISNVLPYLDLLPTIATVGIGCIILFLPFLFAGVTLLGYLLYLLVAVGILWIIAIVIKAPRTYGDLYWLSMYGLTLPICYRLLEVIFRFHVNFLFTVIFLVWMGYVLKNLPKEAKAKRKA